MQFEAYLTVVISNVWYFLVRNSSIILLFLQMKKLRCREEETCPRSKSKSVESLRLDLWSFRFFICCSPLRNQLPFCWRQFSLMEFALPDVHNVLGVILNHPATTDFPLKQLFSAPLEWICFFLPVVCHNSTWRKWWWQQCAEKKDERIRIGCSAARPKEPTSKRPLPSHFVFGDRGR